MRAVLAPRLLQREIEAEERDVGIDLGLVQRREHLARRRRGFLSGRQADQTTLDGVVDRTGALARLEVDVGQRDSAPLPAGAVRVDHRVRVALEQFAADDQHEPLAVGVLHMALVVGAELGVRRPHVQWGHVAQRLLEVVG